MPNPFETWYTDIPPITRIYITLASLTSLAVQLGFVHPLQLWLNFDSIVHSFQWWRLITNFLYFGPISVDFVFHIFFLTRYSRMIEETFFRNKPADYVWLMLFSAIALILCSIIVPATYMPFLGSPLAFTMVYIWARRNTYMRLNFLGLVVFSAPHLPWVLLCFSWLLGEQLPMGDALGIVVGHIYYFFEDVWPNDPASGGTRLLATPRIIRWLIEGNRQPEENLDINDAYDTPANEQQAEDNNSFHDNHQAATPEIVTESTPFTPTTFTTTTTNTARNTTSASATDEEASHFPTSSEEGGSGSSLRHRAPNEHIAA
ncbi:Der1-like family-domain-containing protein [Radiomyces spectabilis]|uniref:Der1-like family-domain-containing protein n=1 Tax=Radiomyces spectabilis TaxID=64574 RepID=UPI00221FE524|nr:Der1-like family-domain-containing protein [Radiomyces spectabilis]KAI8379240.1 Der1-like family-domain-containing protein [Radiomyces spectabilis]